MQTTKKARAKKTFANTQINRAYGIVGKEYTPSTGSSSAGKTRKKSEPSPEIDSAERKRRLDEVRKTGRHPFALQDLVRQEVRTFPNVLPTHVLKLAWKEARDYQLEDISLASTMLSITAKTPELYNGDHFVAQLKALSRLIKDQPPGSRPRLKTKQAARSLLLFQMPLKNPRPDGGGEEELRRYATRALRENDDDDRRMILGHRPDWDVGIDFAAKMQSREKMRAMHDRLKRFEGDRKEATASKRLWSRLASGGPKMQYETRGKNAAKMTYWDAERKAQEKILFEAAYKNAPLRESSAVPSLLSRSRAPSAMSRPLPDDVIDLAAQFLMHHPSKKWKSIKPEVHEAAISSYALL